MIKYLISALTATGNTTKTSIDTITLPANCKQVLGAYSYAMAAATLTSGESPTGILELESVDINIQPCQLPLPESTILTSGAISRQHQVWPLNWPVKGGERIQGSITMDMAQTGALKARFGLVVDVG